ncbi:MAG: hypothetical protein M1830_008015 [Pleopsidium flavum]|nr:MAG: hypothetical protein M1830_008015 [Pleopsidium flavum]
MTTTTTAEPLLSELCRICHTNPPKYRCPRCSTQTCSLPCTKRHKLWAQCSGVRDPAAYIKRNDLATPAGIDRDYNFLTSIERKIDGAERDAVGRGVQLADDANANPHRGHRSGPQKGEVNVQKGIERTGVIVDRAPKGMGRSKDNRTHWHKKHKCLSWTVEWVHEDGKKELGSCLETLPLVEAYARFIADKQPSTKKRKLDGEQNPTPPPSTTTTIATAQPQPSARSTDEQQQQPPPQPPPPNSEPTSPPQTSPLPTAPPPTQPIPASTTPALNFYLHRPHTPTPDPVVIPLPSHSPLSTSLHNRIILEFPTIYTLPYPPSSLPDGYILEDEFLGQASREEKEVEELLALVKGPVDLGAGMGYGEAEGDNVRAVGLDDRKLLDVLKRDLEGVGRFV